MNARLVVFSTTTSWRFSLSQKGLILTFDADMWHMMSAILDEIALSPQNLDQFDLNTLKSVNAVLRGNEIK
jgi:hypothetical protein